MSSRDWWRHGLAAIIGLVIGLAVRSMMKPEVQTRSAETVDSGAAIRSVAERRSRSTMLKRVSALLKKEDGAKRTREETTLLMALIFDLEAEDLKIAIESTAWGGLADREVIAAMFSAWGETEPLEALSAVPSLPHHARVYAAMSVLNVWVLMDADAAFAHSERENPPLRAGERFGPDPDHGLWSHLASVDPDQALARAAKVDDATKRRQLEDETIRLLSYTNAQEALDWLTKNREGEELREGVSRVIRGWAVRKPREALAYLLSLPEELQSKSAFEKLGRSVYRDPEMALEMTDQIPSSYRQVYMGGLVETASRYDPRRAARIGETMAESGVKHEAFRELAANWGADDPVAAANWLATLPRNPSRDWAIRGFAQQVLPHDPETAVTWLVDRDQMEGGLHNALLHWLRRDFTAAKNWMNAQPEERLSEAQRQRALEESERP